VKPDTCTAMRLLIARIRAAIPVGAPELQVCTGDCEVCPVKLLEHLDSQLQGWEYRLAAGERPGLADLSGLASTAREIERVLANHGQGVRTASG
jgi:hypothetical protein